MFAKETWITIISYIITILYITIMIPLSLFPCFFAGFLTYEIIVSFSSYLERFMNIYRARWVAVLIIILILMMIMTTGIMSCAHFFTEDINKIDISVEINRIFSDLKKQLPSFFPTFLPDTVDELKGEIFSWIELNLILIRNMGHTFIHGCITLFIGLVIGIVIACSKNRDTCDMNTYFIDQLLERIYNLSQAFRHIVFAQIKISSVNTLLTSIIIFILFPLFGQSIPLGKTLIIITFIVGLLPIVGNLISNTMITISALSISFSVGMTMLIYLILIHKLEYFLNAEIIGSRINANPWELILAMIFLESIFGIEGLISAPIFYAYLKIELRLKKLI